jgi:hypothetical protein
MESVKRTRRKRGASESEVFNPKPYSLNPNPYTLHPKHYTPNPDVQTLNPKPYTLNPKPYTLGSQDADKPSGAGLRGPVSNFGAGEQLPLDLQG